MQECFTSRLAREVSDKGPAVIGLDPRLEALPADLAPGSQPAERIISFYAEVLPLLAKHVALVKPNIAFFERHGSAGYEAYAETCRLAREAGLIVIGDIKRGDVGSTAEAYAAEHYRHADALTINPYLGTDSVAPFLERCAGGQHGVFVLVRTSNPSATEFQDLPVPGGTLSQAVARAVDRWAHDIAPESAGYTPVGAVVGATYANQLDSYRELMPRSWLLIPGVGVQGAKISDLTSAFDSDGLGALISQSRGVMQNFAPDEEDWRAKIEAALRSFVTELSSQCQQGP